MDRQEYEKITLDVAKHFQSPAEILNHKDLSKEEKIKLLQQWDYDLQLLMVATEENMTGTGVNQTAEKVKDVRNALAELGVAKDPEKSSPNKVGSMKNQKI